MKVLNKHVRWRKEKQEILICDCKRMIDLKIPLKFEKIMAKFERGFDENLLENEEKILFSDLKKLNLISELNLRPLNTQWFPIAMQILDDELEIRVRDNNFLGEMFKKYPEFFRCIIIDNEIAGIICGFPREDYLLISELAVKSAFQKRGFGKQLVTEFEKIAKIKGYKKIAVGAMDNAIEFYNSLGYKPFLLIQYKRGDYSEKEFKKLYITRKVEDNEDERLEVNCKIDLKLLERLRKKFPKANFQYIFTKKL